MKISIIIPNYNGEALLEANLPAVLRAKDFSKNNILEIIVVDDGSKDKSVEVVKKNFPSVKLIKHTINRGFSAAVNTGVRAAKGDLICLLNSDVIPEKNFLESVLNYFNDKALFAVSFNEIGKFGWAKGIFTDGFIGHTPGGKSQTSHVTFWVSGGSGIFRRYVWMELGGMDDKLFSPFYWEDIDLCYRALKRGYKLLWDPKAKVEHQHQTTIKNISKKYVEQIQERNQLIFIWKNLTSKNLFKKHIAGLVKRSATHPGYLLIVLKALGKIGFIVKARKKEIKEAIVSDEVIFSRFAK
jgi:GT2 family glycosyltransferase